LVEFKSSSEGARMLVGAGSRQSIDWADGDVETFTTNTAAMVDAVQESYPSTWTPLSEALYETARYVAQIQSTFTTGYVYPIAFFRWNFKRRQFCHERCRFDRHK
jgi:type IV pilus assembly protein PilY1